MLINGNRILFLPAKETLNKLIAFVVSLLTMNVTNILPFVLKLPKDLITELP